MKQIEKMASAKNFTAVSVGKMSELGEYLLELGSEVNKCLFFSKAASMPHESGFVGQRKRFRWHLKPLSFL